MTRTDIINDLIKKYNFQSYLEVGTRNKEHNFNKIECKEKLCIDPYPETPPVDLVMTSDEFFKVCGKTFDIIFIDGLHEAHQVFKDINNAMAHLNKGGVIVCHDCMPSSMNSNKDYEDYQGVELWNGDSWKAFVKYRFFSDFLCYVITEDEGCGIIDTNIPTDLKTKATIFMNELNYKYYLENKDSMMNFKDSIQ